MRRLMTEDGEPDWSELMIDVDSLADVSDGYHTIEELYDHRITLYIALCRMYSQYREPTKWDTKEGRQDHVWRSGKHSDGTHYDGWFLLAIGTKPGKQITYHIPISRWNETKFAATYEKAPVEFDGHTSSDVIARLKNL